MSLLDKMRILEVFRRPSNSTAEQAKERLQIIIARDRFDQSDGPDYLPELKRELLAVIKKYVNIDKEQVKVNLDKESDYEVLELNIVLPEQK